MDVEEELSLIFLIGDWFSLIEKTMSVSLSVIEKVMAEEGVSTHISISFQKRMGFESVKDFLTRFERQVNARSNQKQVCDNHKFITTTLARENYSAISRRKQ